MTKRVNCCRPGRFIGGVIESSKLTPTASREDLQRDETWVAVQGALKEALISGLSDLAQNQPEIWRRVLMRHNEALLGAALCDDRLFDLLKDRLQVPTSKARCWQRIYALITAFIFC